jgi:transposase
LTTKILALTDALGNLVRFVLLPGHRYDTLGVAPLIQDIEFEGFIADKAFDANWIIDELNERGAKIVISQRPKRRIPLPIDREIYKWRHLIENFFCRLKEFKRPCHAQRQDGPELRRHDIPCGCCDPFTVNLNSPRA